jgi:hypothetical protein
MQFAAMLARRINKGHSGTISINRQMEFFPAFVVIFNAGNFNRLQLPARHY